MLANNHNVYFKNSNSVSVRGVLSRALDLQRRVNHLQVLCICVFTYDAVIDCLLIANGHDIGQHMPWVGPWDP